MSIGDLVSRVETQRKERRKLRDEKMVALGALLGHLGRIFHNGPGKDEVTGGKLIEIVDDANDQGSRTISVRLLDGKVEIGVTSDGNWTSSFSPSAFPVFRNIVCTDTSEGKAVSLVFDGSSPGASTSLPLDQVIARWLELIAERESESLSGLMVKSGRGPARI